VKEEETLMRMFVSSVIFACLCLGALACNSAPMRTYRWAGLIDRGLPGTWTSDKYGRLIVSCDGYIHLDDQGGFDLSNTGLKNAKIVELGEKELLIETMPLIKSRYSMAAYPHEEKGVWKMNFWGREWKRSEKRECGTANST
jgi:hypothetical protein